MASRKGAKGEKRGAKPIDLCIQAEAVFGVPRSTVRRTCPYCAEVVKDDDEAALTTEGDALCHYGCKQYNVGRKWG